MLLPQHGLEMSQKVAILVKNKQEQHKHSYFVHNYLQQIIFVFLSLRQCLTTLLACINVTDLVKGDIKLWNMAPKVIRIALWGILLNNRGHYQNGCILKVWHTQTDKAGANLTSFLSLLTLSCSNLKIFCNFHSGGEEDDRWPSPHIHSLSTR
jgi:hypothetical protein